MNRRGEPGWLFVVRPSFQPLVWSDPEFRDDVGQLRTGVTCLAIAVARQNSNKRKRQVFYVICNNGVAGWCHLDDRWELVSDAS